MERISETENLSFLEKILDIFDSQDDIRKPNDVHLFSDEEMKAIDKVEQDVENGHFLTSEEANKEIREWLKNLKN